MGNKLTKVIGKVKDWCKTHPWDVGYITGVGLMTTASIFIDKHLDKKYHRLHLGFRNEDDKKAAKEYFDKVAGKKVVRGTDFNKDKVIENIEKILPKISDDSKVNVEITFDKCTEPMWK